MSIVWIEGIGEITLVRSSRRRTVAAQICPDGSVKVHAPGYYPKALIKDFLMRRRDWIILNQRKIIQKNSLQDQQGEEKYLALTARYGSGKKAIEDMRRRTREILSEKVPLYAERIGVSYGKVSVRAMKSRWGSCSMKGDLSFNILLCELPEEVTGYVIIHELCHRVHMDHSARFWQLVGRYDPAFQEHRRYLKDHGTQLITTLEKLKASD